MIVAIIITVIVLVIVSVVVYLEYKAMSVKSEILVIKKPIDVYNKVNVDSEWRRTKSVIIPSYVSKDEYKDIKDMATRNKRVFTDYFYLLDLAIRSYYECDINNYKTDRKCLPILVFAKYAIDYDSYIRNINPADYKKEFDAKYSKMPNVLKIMDFLNKAAIDYSYDKDGFNAIIFDISRGGASEPSCKLASNERIIYQEKIVEKPYILQNSLGCNIIKMYTDADIYKDMSLDARNTSILSDVVVVLKAAIRNYHDYEVDIRNLLQSLQVNPLQGTCNKTSDNNSALYDSEKYLRILAAVKYLLMYDNYIEMIPASQRDVILQQFESETAAFDALSQIIFYTLFDMPGFMTAVNGMYSKYCNKLEEVKPQPCIQPVSNCAVSTPNVQPLKKEATDYAIMPTEARNKAVLTNLGEYFKNAIETLVSAKEQLYEIYKNRKTDKEFLQIKNFVPVLQYAKFIEDNKVYLDQISPTDKTTVLKTLYPDFDNNQIFYVQGLHVQMFIIIATNLYTTIPFDVNNVIFTAIQQFS